MTLAIKGSAETRNSTTALADDSDLLIALDAGKLYRIESIVGVYSAATPDFKFRFHFSGDLSWVNGSIIYNDDVLSTSSFGSASAVQCRNLVAGWLTDGTSVLVVNGSATSTFRSCIWMRGWLKVGGSGGDLSLQWAQNTSNAGNTTTDQDSWLRAIEHVVPS
jgi:hypothetical protein